LNKLTKRQQAFVAGYNEIASKIMEIQNALEAESLTRDLPRSQAWDHVKTDIISGLIEQKVTNCTECALALKETKPCQ
jgi:hypothetical protein